MAHKNERSEKLLVDLLPFVSLGEKDANLVVTGLTIDSRKVKSGFVFVAVQGVSTHGEQYIPQAIQQGAVAVLTQSENSVSIAYEQDIPVIAIPLLEEKLSGIAGCFYHRPSLDVPVIGFTGTNGKTTCSQLFAQLSALLGDASGVVGTLGYGVCRQKNETTVLLLTSTGMTTPDAINTQSICAALVAEGASNLVMEVSSHGLVQSRIAAIDVNTAVFTNLTHDHLDYHGSMLAYGEAKAKLFTMPSLNGAVLNGDDEFSKQLLEYIDDSVSVVTYSLENKNEDIFLTECHYQSAGVTAVLNTPRGQYPFKTSLVGSFNLSNLLAVLSVFYVNDDQFEKAVTQVEQLKPVSGRMELIENSLNKQVVIDYAHTPDALKNALQALSIPLDISSETRGELKGKLWCVFGCGGNRDEAKRPLMASVAETYADRVVVTNDNPRHESAQMIVDDIARGFLKEKHHIIFDRQQAIEYALSHSDAGDVILVAGKGHEDYQLVGDEVISFSDQKTARLILRGLEQQAKNKNFMDDRQERHQESGE